MDIFISGSRHWSF